jgi:hypothetical protein
VGGQSVAAVGSAKRPLWLGQELERWLASNGYLGTRPKLLENGEHIVEGIWHWNGGHGRGWGFIGMEQFGSRDIAAGRFVST